MLRRSTHRYCAFCGDNMRDYDQKTCDSCLLDLNQDMVVSWSDTRKIHYKKRISLYIESNRRKIHRMLKMNK